MSMRAFARAKAGAHVWTQSPRGVCGLCYKCKRRMRQCCCYEDRSLARSISEHVNMFSETNLGADTRSAHRFPMPVSRQTVSVRHYSDSPGQSPYPAERPGEDDKNVGGAKDGKDALVPQRSDSRKKLSIQRVRYPDGSAAADPESDLVNQQAGALRACDAFETSSGLDSRSSLRGGPVALRLGQRPQSASRPPSRPDDGRRMTTGMPSAHLTSSSHSAYRDWKGFDFLKEPRVDAVRGASPASGVVPGQPVRPWSATGSPTRPGTSIGYSYRSVLRREGRARGEFWGVNDTYNGARPFGEGDDEAAEAEIGAEDGAGGEEEEVPSRDKVDDLIRQLRVLCYRKVRCGGGDVSVREIFRRFDANKDTGGNQLHQGIDLEEFTDAMKRLMLGTAEQGLITDKQARHVFMRLDKDNDGTIDFRETAMSLSLPGWDNKILGRKSNVLL